MRIRRWIQKGRVVTTEENPKHSRRVAREWSLCLANTRSTIINHSWGLVASKRTTKKSFSLLEQHLFQCSTSTVTWWWWQSCILLVVKISLIHDVLIHQYLLIQKNILLFIRKRKAAAMIIHDRLQHNLNLAQAS